MQASQAPIAMQQEHFLHLSGWFRSLNVDFASLNLGNSDPYTFPAQMCLQMSFWMNLHDGAVQLSVDVVLQAYQ